MIIIFTDNYNNNTNIDAYPGLREWMNGIKMNTNIFVQYNNKIINKKKRMMKHTLRYTIGSIYLRTVWLFGRLRKKYLTKLYSLKWENERETLLIYIY